MARKRNNRGSRRAVDQTSDWSRIKSSFASMDVYDKVAWASLLAIVFLVPLAMSNLSFLGFQTSFTNDQFDLPKVVVLRGLSLIALGAWGWGLAMRGGKVRTHKVFFLVAFFLVWALIASLTSVHVPTAFLGKYKRFDGWVSYVNYALLMFLALQYSERASRVRALAVTFTASMGIAALYGVAQSLGIDLIDWGQIPFEAKRAFSTFGNPDMFGGALAFSAPIALGLTLSTKRTFDRVLYWIIFLLMMWAVVVSFVRGAWIGVFIGLALLVAAVIVQRGRLQSIDYGFIGATLAAVAAVIVRSLSVDHEVMNFGRRFASLLDTKTGSGLTRTQIWQAAIDGIKDRPLFGFGPDTFRLQFPKYKPVEYVAAAGYRSVADNAHNYPLQMATGVGIPGAVALYGIFAWVAIASAKHVFTRRDPGGANMLLAGLWAGSAAYIAHLMVGLSLVGASTFLWVALALLIAPGATVRSVAPLRQGRLVGGVLLAVVALGLIGNGVFYMADVRYLGAVMSGARGDAAGVETQVKQALALNPYNELYRAQPGVVWSEDAARRIQNGDREGAIASYERARVFIVDARDYSPLEYDNYVFLAANYNARASLTDDRSDFEEALIIADQGIAVSEFGPAIRVQKAVALASLGRIEEAREAAAYAFEMDPAYTAAKQLAEQLGRSE